MFATLNGCEQRQLQYQVLDTAAKSNADLITMSQTLTTLAENVTVIGVSVTRNAGEWFDVGFHQITLLMCRHFLLTVCGNYRCEHSEPCADNTCSNPTSCPTDCPFLFQACPVGYSEADGRMLACAGAGQCYPVTGQCGCNVGYSGANCSGCASGFGLSSGLRCQQVEAILATTCYNGIKDAGEISVDCGGAACPSSRQTCDAVLGGRISFQTLRYYVIWGSTGALVLSSILIQLYVQPGTSNAVAPDPDHQRKQEQVAPETTPQPAKRSRTKPRASGSRSTNSSFSSQ